MTREIAEGLVALLEQSWPGWTGFEDPRYLEEERNYKLEASKTAQERLSKAELQRLIDDSEFEEIVDRLKKIGQSTNLLFLAAPSSGDLAILYGERLDHRAFAHEILALLHGSDDSPARLRRFVDWTDEQGLPNKWTFPTYFLFLTHPDSDLFVKPTRITAFTKRLELEETFGGRPDPDQYALLLAVGHRLHELLVEYSPRDMIDIQGFMWCVSRVDPDHDIAYWKVAPGRGAWEWPACREDGFIALGWHELGDVTGMSAEELESHAKSVGVSVSAKNQTWKFIHEMKVGDLVVANKGKSEVVGLGKITGDCEYIPESAAPDLKHRLRRSVDWYDTKRRVVHEPGWNITVIQLDREKFEDIAAAPGTGAPPLDPAFSRAAFELLEGIHHDPTKDYYSSRRNEFVDHVERPFQELFRAVIDRLVPEIKRVMETEKGLFGRFLKNDWGRGGAWDFYWGAIYPKNQKRVEHAQLYASIHPTHLEAGFYIGEYSDTQVRDRFLRNLRAEPARLIALVSESLEHHDLDYGPRESATSDDVSTFEEYVNDSDRTGHRVAQGFSRERVLETSRADLSEKIASLFRDLFPLVLLALTEDPFPEITSYLGASDVEDVPNEKLPLAAISETTGFPLSTLERWTVAIERKKQAVFYGPPGTGKTFIAEKIAQHLVGGGYGFVELVQFHPSYAYEDFIQGIRPDVTAEGDLVYRLVAGRFREFCRRAARREGLSVLIIDEINRANLSRVLGELMYLLEYRDREIPLAGGERFQIPSNVRLIGTMNTADRSIALVDHALRRRFAFLHLEPDFDILRHYHEREETGFDPTGLIEQLRLVNTQINDPHYHVGISFFLRPDLASQIEDIWGLEIEPYLEEYFFDQAEKVTELRWPKVEQKIVGR